MGQLRSAIVMHHSLEVCSAKTEATPEPRITQTISSRLSALALAGLLVLIGATARATAQQVASIASGDRPFSTSADTASLPEAPAPQTPGTASYENDQHTDGQSKRIFGIIPNFRAVNADVHLPPQTVKEKFVTASQDSFDYSSIFIPLAVAGYNYERNATPEFGTGGVAYGRYLWHSVVDQTSENYLVEFIVPAITHEDTRFYSLGHGGFVKRSEYALSRAVITRSDSGKRTFNYGEVVGAGAAAGLSNLYYPSPERTFSNTGTQWATNVGIDAISFFVKEFSPDINHTLFHGKKSH
jgi:hypothetical protein